MQSRGEWTMQGVWTQHIGIFRLAAAASSPRHGSSREMCGRPRHSLWPRRREHQVEPNPYRLRAMQVMSGVPALLESQAFPVWCEDEKLRVRSQGEFPTSRRLDAVLLRPQTVAAGQVNRLGSSAPQGRCSRDERERDTEAKGK